MIYRRKVIAGNWKMNKTQGEARALIKDLIRDIGKFDEAEIVVCPPFTALPAVSELLSPIPNIRLGAQNFYEAPFGAFTGEVSAGMLRELYVRYVIIGHSERRHYFHEDDAVVNRKAKAALAVELRPIVCIGETLEQRQSGHWADLLEKQVQAGLAGLEEKELSDLLLAYEPIWAIGTGQVASVAQVEETHRHVRSMVAKHVSSGAAERVRILYGGSVKPDNARELLALVDVDGALVGGASLDARGFSAIVKNACPTLVKERN